MKDPNNPCLFCKTPKKEYEFENDLAYASYDSYPVSKLHALIIPKRHIKDYFDLNEDEVIACNEDRKSTRLNSSHSQQSRMPSSA